MVLIVHDINFAATYSDRIIALRDGRIAASDTVGAMMRAEVLTDVFDTPVRVHEVDGRPTAVYYR